jgi:hypothetical protein
VNGTVKTVGRRPAANWAAKVAPFHAYSTALTSMFGCCFSNNATLSSNCFFASSELPGRSDATLIVTFAFGDPLFADALETEPAHTASRLATATATVVALRVNFMVLLLSCAPFR